MNHMKLTKLIAFLGIAASGNVAAQDSGFYIGGGVVASEFESKAYDIQLPSIPPQVIPGTVTKDESEGFKILAGYRMNRNFAIEADYTSSGKFKERDEANQLTTEVEVTSVNLALVGLIPLADGRFDLFGRIGASFGDLSLKIVEDNPSPTVPVAGPSAPDGSQTDLLWGVGGQFNLGSRNQTSIRLEYTGVEYSDVERLNMVSLSLTYRF